MSLVERTKQRAAEVIEPDETLQAAFGAQTVAPTLMGGILVAFGGLILLLNMVIRRPLRVVVVTDRRYLVCRAGPFSRSKIRTLLEEFPRDRPLAQPGGKWWMNQSLGAPMWVHKRFFDEIRAAERVRSVRKPTPRPTD